MRLVDPICRAGRWPRPAAAQHQHGKPGSAPEAFTATPAFAPDGTLWVVRPAGDRIVVQRSTDLGKTFAAPGHGDARADEPRLGTRCAGAHRRRSQGAAGRHLRHVPGQELQRPRLLRPLERRRRLFTSRVRITATRPASASRSRASTPTAGSSRPGWTSATSPRRAPPAAYPGAALAYAWEDGDAGFGNTAIALDNTCECCRLGLAFAGAGRPAVVFRNIFPGSVRDHGVITFRDPATPGPRAPRQRRRLEDRGLPASRPQPWRSRPTARTTSPGSPTARRARACSMPEPIPATRPTPSRGPCRPPIASRRGPISWPTAWRCTSCGRSSTATRWRCAGRSATTAVVNGARPAPWPRRRTPLIILCSSPTGSALTCRGSPRTRATA